jgi:hypothetical protein
MTKERLKRQIKVKFGSQSKFARLAGIDRYDLQKLFARKDEDHDVVQEIWGICQSTANTGESTDLNQAVILRLSKAIKKAGGVYRFAKDNPEFAEKSVYQILSGKRKRITPNVTKLLQHFELV